MDAHFTNTLTNLFHAGFLFSYFLLTIKYKLSKNVKVFFFLIFSSKICGASVHYTQNLLLQDFLWVIITVQLCFINYFSSRIIHIRNTFLFLLIPTVSAIIFCLPAVSRITKTPLLLGLANLFPLNPEDFTYLAIAILWVSFSSIFKTYSWVRLGFLFTFLSNIIWIALRKFLTNLHGGFLPPDLRYDNDVYHFLLIISTYILFKGLKNTNKFY